MCALFGSPDRQRFVELALLNSYRGSHSHSICTTDQSNGVITSCYKTMGEFQMLDTISGDYYIGHAQAPTTEAKSMDSVHPSVEGSGFLWHNGILFDSYVKTMQKEQGIKCNWDTKLLHHKLNKEGFSSLSQVKGSFACVYNDGANTYLFRNENCPLFTDGVSYSSTEFMSSNPIQANVVYQLKSNKITKTPITFKTAQEFFWSLD